MYESSDKPVVEQGSQRPVSDVRSQYQQPIQRGEIDFIAPHV